MPPPPNERRRLELELAELPDQIAGYERELTTTPIASRARREWLDWQIRRARNHLAALDARLAALRAEGP